MDGELVRARSFRDLNMWQDAHRFVLNVDRVSGEFPNPEMFGLASRFRRAAVSVPANIAEAFKRRSPTDKARILNIAESSLDEFIYYCVLSQDLGYPVINDWDAKALSLQKQIQVYAKKAAESGRQRTKGS